MVRCSITGHVEDSPVPAANPYLLPKSSWIRFYNGRGRILAEFKRRKIDFADEIMLFWYKNQRTVIFGLTIRDGRLRSWDLALIDKVEWLLRYDFGFDGYRVIIKRLTDLGGPLTDEFRWKLMIRVQLPRNKS